MTMFKQDEEGHIVKVGTIKPATKQKPDHAKIMQDRSDALLRERIRALDARERQIVIETLNEKSKKEHP